MTYASPMHASHIVADVESSLPTTTTTLAEHRRARCVHARKWMPARAWALLAGMLACLTLACAASAYAAPTRATCAEDDPCWSWSTMGNRTRGITSLNGTPLVVGPCRYARMWRRAHALHMARLLGPALRGDAWARRYGCTPRH